MNSSFNDKLGRLVEMTHRALRRQLNRRLADGGDVVTSDQLIIILCLSQQDGLSQKQIADICGKDKTSTTRMIDTMQKHGLVNRVPDKVDRRQNMIYLTDKGHATLASMLDAVEATHEQALAGVSPEEIEVCKKVLKEVLNNLIKVDSSWPLPRFENSKDVNTKE